MSGISASSNYNPGLVSSCQRETPQTRAFLLPASTPEPRGGAGGGGVLSPLPTLLCDDSDFWGVPKSEPEQGVTLIVKSWGLGGFPKTVPQHMVGVMLNSLTKSRVPTNSLGSRWACLFFRGPPKQIYIYIYYTYIYIYNIYIYI